MSTDLLQDEPMLADIRVFNPDIEDQIFEEGQYDIVNSFLGHQSQRFLRRNIDSTVTELLHLALYGHPDRASCKIINAKQSCFERKNVIIEVVPKETSNKLPIEIIKESCMDLSLLFDQLINQIQSL